MTTQHVSTLRTQQVAAMLQRADILLTRGSGLQSRLIRWATRSHWNHVAVVFVLGDLASGQDHGYHSTFIIEAQAHGVDVHPIDKYLCNEKQDMAILRLPEGSVPTEFRLGYLKRVRGFALEEIDAGYGYSAIGGIISRLFGWVGAPFAWLASQIKLIVRTPGVSQVVNRWICSGIVQFAYFRACFGSSPTSGPWENHFANGANLAQVVFNSDVRADVENGLDYDPAVARLMLTTPAHFALAATYSQLSVVAERIAGKWSDNLTQP